MLNAFVYTTASMMEGRAESLFLSVTPLPPTHSWGGWWRWEPRGGDMEIIPSFSRHHYIIWVSGQRSPRSITLCAIPLLTLPKFLFPVLTSALILRRYPISRRPDISTWVCSGYLRPPTFSSSRRSRPRPVSLMAPCPSICSGTSWEPSRFCSSSHVLHPNYQNTLLAPPSPSTQTLAPSRPSMAAAMVSATSVSCRDRCCPPPQSPASALAPDRWFSAHIPCELDHILSLLKTLP